MMKNRTAYFCFWVLLNLAILPLVQGQEMGSERLKVQTDRSIYATGETIWFKVFAWDQNQRSSSLSKVAYVELLGPTNEPLTQVKIELKAGAGSGTFELAGGLPNGYYRIIAYTQLMRNWETSFYFQKDLLVLNPLMPMLKDTIDSRAGLDNGVEELRINHTLQIQVQVNKETLSQRAPVRLDFFTKDASGKPIAAELAVSVALKHPFDLAALPRLSNLSDSKSEGVTWPVEDKGLTLTGKVVDAGKGDGLAGKDLFLAFPGKRTLVYTDLTDDQGRFDFLLPPLFGLKQMVLQVRGGEDKNITIQLDDPFLEKEIVEPPVFSLPASWESTINQTIANAQIMQAYGAFEPQVKYVYEDPFETISFFGEPDKQYRLDDFTRFPLPEFFYEVVPEVRVRGKFGEEQLSVLNEFSNVPDNIPPLFLVDGVPVFDQATFLKINNKLIESTELVYAPIWLNPGVFNGVIQLSSFEGDARCFPLPKSALRRTYLAFLPQKTFTAPTYQEGQPSKMPDFRNTLYWNPTIKTDDTGKASVSFYTSDALGEYLIEVIGTTPKSVGTEQVAVKIVSTIE